MNALLAGALMCAAAVAQDGTSTPDLQGLTGKYAALGPTAAAAKAAKARDGGTRMSRAMFIQPGQVRHDLTDNRVARLNDVARSDAAVNLGGLRGTLPCDGSNAVFCVGSGADNAGNSTAGQFKQADNFVSGSGGDIVEGCFQGTYTGTGPFVDNFTVQYWQDTDFDAVPDATPLATFNSGNGLVVTGPGDTGTLIAGAFPALQWHYTHPAVNVNGFQCYWISISNDLADGQSFFWQDGDATSGFADGNGFEDGTPDDPFANFDFNGAGGDRSFCLNIDLTAPGNACFPPFPEEICQDEFGGGCQVPSADANAFLSDGVEFTVAEDFTPLSTGPVTTVCFWGVYDGGPQTDNFRIRVYSSNNGVPGTVLATYNAADLTVTRGATLRDIGGDPEFEYSAALNSPLNLTAGTCYWIEIANLITANWFWSISDPVDDTASADVDSDGTYVFGDELIADMAMCVNTATGDANACLAIATNQTCDTATTLTVGAAAQTGFNLRVPAQLIPPANDAFFGFFPTVWYRVVGNGRNLTVSTCGTDTGFDSIVVVYCGNTCGALNAIGFNDDTAGCGSGDSADLASSVSFCSTNGQQYFVAVQGFGGAEGVFDINVTDGAGGCTPASCSHCQISTTGSTPEANETCGGADGNGTCPTAEPLALGNAGRSGQIFTFLGGTNADTPSRDLDTFRFTVPNNSSVNVVINAEFPFLAQVRRFTAVNDCATTAFVTNITGAACTASTTTLNLTAGDYTIVVTSNGFTGLPCGANNDYRVNVSVVSFNPPDNDGCAAAVPLTVGATFNGTTLGATDDVFARACGFSTNTGSGVWYTVTGDGSTFTLDLCNASTNFDTQVAVFCGDCTHLACVGQNDDGPAAACNALASQLTWETSAGTIYRIAVYGFGAQSGNFQGVVTSDNSQCGVAQACAACDITVPGGATVSPEPCGTVFGGAFPASMCPTNAAQQDILAAPGTFTGSFATGDADLVRIGFVAVAGQSTFQVTVRSEVPINILPVIQTCPNVFTYTVGGVAPPQVTVGACGTGGFVFTFPTAGLGTNQHALLVRGLGGTTVGCPGGTGNNYTISVERVGTVSLPNQFGACCMDDGTCQTNFQLECTQAGGTFQGEGTACGTVTCPAPQGACCFPDGSCTALSEADCTGARGGTGVYNGNCIPCNQVTCESQTGSCCIDRCTCVETSEEDCSNQGGVFGGGGSTCGDPTLCFPNPACPCDVNGVDGLDSQDFFDFLDFFFVTDLQADINCFDGVDSQDYFDFVDCFFGGVCP